MYVNQSGLSTVVFFCTVTARYRYILRYINKKKDAWFSRFVCMFLN